MADIIDSSIKFHYGSLSNYEKAKKEGGKIRAQDIYFVVADGDEDSSALEAGFLYLNGKKFGSGIVDVSVSEVVDSSFIFAVKKFDSTNGTIVETKTTIPVSDPSIYESLVERINTLDSSVSALESDVSALESDVSTLKDDMLKILGEPKYDPDDPSEGKSTKGYLDLIDERIVEIETTIEKSVGDISTLANFSYTDSSNNSHTAINVIELNQDQSTRDASLGVFIDGKFLNFADVSVGGNLTKKVLTVNTAEIQAAVVDVPVYKMEKLVTPNEGYISSYRLNVTQGGSTTAAGVDIDIPKDFLVKSAELKTVETADTPYTGAKVGDKYIDFVINVKEGTETDEHIYLPVNDLVDVYTVANDSSQYLSIDKHEISFDPDKTAKYVDSSLKITEKFTTLDTSVSAIQEHLLWQGI